MNNNASILTDSQLVRDTRNGNTESYNLLVEKYYGLVFSVVYSRVQHRETSEDISQEVFLRAYLNLNKLDTPECFSAWLCKLARNLSIDSLRKESELIHQFKSLKPSEKAISRIVAILAAVSSLSPQTKTSLPEKGIKEGANLFTISSGSHQNLSILYGRLKANKEKQSGGQRSQITKIQ